VVPSIPECLARAQRGIVFDRVGAGYAADPNDYIQNMATPAVIDAGVFLIHTSLRIASRLPQLAWDDLDAGRTSAGANDE
jgi:hypothetical protein